MIRTDCLVIGAGFAGSAYALLAAKEGLEVQLLSLGGPLQANSDWAQGGIVYDISDQPELLARDIMEASAGTANPAAVDQLVREGPAAVREILIDEGAVAKPPFPALHAAADQARLGRGVAGQPGDVVR